MFKKILVANRGEVALRVMRTARAMGIETVAVYSEADEDAPHVRQADEAVALGPPPPAESYLVIDKIVEAVVRTGSEAVHPGYGFLAENPSFAEAVEAAGAAFIGPGPEAIATMGDKVAAKKLALKAGLDPIPGPLRPVASPKDAMRVARELGYPVVIKAAAGGGGKGMRVVDNDEETGEGFGAAAAEARMAFGDDRLFVEKLIRSPRHIEVQVLADAFGDAIHLGERECSIQRRYQKVIEEAPSPLVDAKMRAAMGDKAVALAKAAGYRSAGTVEFVVDGEKNVYFLEMNTRLQVEHPVTELVTGLDLVEQMIRIAAGERLGLAQEAVQLDGWAIEARVYAEDPERGFLPSAGRLVRYRPPAAGGVRVDDGVEEGSEISPHYDPMIAKLCAFGASRAEALDRLRPAVDAFLIRGVSHNLRFLAAVLRHPRFAEGRLSTRFVAEAYGGGFHGAPLEGEVRDVLVATGVLVHLRETERAERISGQMPGHRPAPRERWVVDLEGEEDRVRVVSSAQGYEFTWRRRRLAVESAWRPGEPLVRATVDGRAVSVEVERLNEGYRLACGGASARIVVRDERAAGLARLMPARAARDRSRHVLSPMPGLVVSVAVAAGDEVKAGQPLAVVDAMKMENVLRAERDGRIAKVCVAAGDSLAADEVILEFT
ncbi:MAG: biotin carboxylase N-terminal domain-containing protein [Alphaproteobacteria bacterium]